MTAIVVAFSVGFIVTASTKERHAANQPAPATATEQDELVAKARFTSEDFRNAKDLAWVRENVGRAKAVMIIPQLVKGGFFLGGSGGNGVLLARHTATGTWSYPAFYTMGSITFGLQMGGEVSEIVMLVMTDKGMKALLTPEFKLGGDVSVAAGPVGAGAQAQTADIIAFSRTKGLYGGLNVEGAVIAPRNDWNQAYYKRTVQPRDILIDGDVQNAGSDALRTAVGQLGTQSLSMN